MSRIGPGKGAIHLAAGMVVNAAQDLWRLRLGKPMWLLIGE